LARILVIDDEEPVRHLLRLVLELAGHEVVLAEDGLRGLGVVRRQHPTVVILDVMMPFMDGGTVLDQLQSDEKTRDIPILILTAATVTSLRSRLLQSGAARVMTKPFDPAEIVAAVNELVASEAQVSAPSSATAAVPASSDLRNQR
jgi:DNA-binding response OmpR family regulator